MLDLGGDTTSPWSFKGLEIQDFVKLIVKGHQRNGWHELQGSPISTKRTVDPPRVQLDLNLLLLWDSADATL